MTLVTIGLLILMAGFAEGGRARRSAYLYTRAVILSEEAMDRILGDEELEEGVSEGTFESSPGFSWTCEVTALEPPSGQEEKDKKPFLLVSLTTAWPDQAAQKSLNIRTLVPAPEE